MSTASSSILLSFGPKPPSSSAERNALAIMLAISGAILLLIAIFYLLNPRGVVGDSLVNLTDGNPDELPPPGSFPFYLKPVTILFIAMVGFAYCFFALVQRPVLNRLPKWVLSIFLVASIVFFAMSVYEVFFNFSLWSSLLVTSTSNPDQAVNTYPVNTVKVNLVYATKTFVALLFVTYFAIVAVKNSIEISSK